MYIFLENVVRYTFFERVDPILYKDKKMIQRKIISIQRERDNDHIVIILWQRKLTWQGVKGKKYEKFHCQFKRINCEMIHFDMRYVCLKFQLFGWIFCIW